MPRTVEEVRRAERLMAKCSLIGIPLEEVGGRLKALDESLRQNGMALKADTGVHIDCSRDKVALGFALEVVVFKKESEDVKL